MSRAEPSGRAAVLTLPYAFDTTRVNAVLLKGVLGLEIVFVVGILYSVAVTHTMAAALGLSLGGGLLAFFASRAFTGLEGSVGIITAREVVVRQGGMFGVRLPGPVGTFAIDQFKAIRVEESAGPTRPDVQGGPHERIYLVGKQGVPSILIARTDRYDVDRGVALGRELGRMLGLPCEEAPVPY